MVNDDDEKSEVSAIHKALKDGQQELIVSAEQLKKMGIAVEGNDTDTVNY